jgi:predicted PurR-regulated permease PerM
VTLFGAYFGIIGMFLAVPIVTVIKLSIDDYIEIKNRAKIQKENKE